MYINIFAHTYPYYNIDYYKDRCIGRDSGRYKDRQANRKQTLKKQRENNYYSRRNIFHFKICSSDWFLADVTDISAWHLMTSLAALRSRVHFEDLKESQIDFDYNFRRQRSMFVRQILYFRELDEICETEESENAYHIAYIPISHFSLSPG